MRLLNGFIDWISGNQLAGPRSAGETTEITATAARPLARIHRAAEEAAALTERLFSEARLLEERLTEIQEQLGLAWQEQAQSHGDYYALLRAILLLLDDCRMLGEDQGVVSNFTARLEKLLAESGVEAIAVAKGSRFCPDIHVCAKAEPTTDTPSGVVLSTLTPGYQRRLPSGEMVTVRPANVVVSQSPTECEESRK